MNLNLTQFKTLKTGITTSQFHFLGEKEKKKIKGAVFLHLVPCKLQF